MAEESYDASQARIAARIAHILRTTSNNSFSFYRNDPLIGQVALTMARRITSQGVSEFSEERFRRAWYSLEFPLFAELLDVIVSADDAESQWIDAVLNGDGSLLYGHQMNRFRRIIGDEVQTQQYCGVPDLASIFRHEAGRDQMIFWSSGADTQCLRLFADANWRLMDLIEIQPDLPGVNSLVREGLVKSLRLPCGSRVITKRDNPSKQGRFLNEQHNVAEIIARLGLPSQSSFVEIGDGLRLKVIRPFAVAADRAHEVFYSFAHYEAHPTLEFILLHEESASKRQYYLHKARRVLDHLYSKGIVWGDMAPRNILVEDDGNVTTVFLLDFEKTYFTDGEVLHSQRLEHARGPMCVEEFGAVCLLQEVVQCFTGYFDPDTWDVSDPSPIALSKPKREVIDILAANGHPCPTMGEYNATEKAMIDVRFPFIGEDLKKRLPLHASFKIDHYLGADYDRKTTQLFMNARACQLFSPVVDALNSALQQVENGLVLSQINARIAGTLSKGGAPSFHRLSSSIDALYEAGTNTVELQVALHRLSVLEHFESVRAQFQLSPFEGLTEAGANWERIESHLTDFMSKLSRNYDSKVIVVLYGGAARCEFSKASDLDIGVISEDREIAFHLEREILEFSKRNLGISVELFPAISPATLEAFILSNPACFLDFFHGRVILGTKDLVESYASIVASCLAREDYQRNVLGYYGQAFKDANLSIKTLIKMSHVAMAFGIECPPLLQNILLSAKCESSFSSDGTLFTDINIPWVQAQLKLLHDRLISTTPKAE